MKHLGLFAAGVLFGTAGLKILSSKEAKSVYAHTTAAVLRAKDCVMQTVTTIREGADGQGHQRPPRCRGRARDDRGYRVGRGVNPFFCSERAVFAALSFLKVQISI